MKVIKHVLLSLIFINSLLLFADGTNVKPDNTEETEVRVKTHDANKSGGYLFAHLTKSGYGQIHYALSPDGLHWQELNQGKVVHETYRGHPDITRGPDGRFFLVGNVGKEGKHNSNTPIAIWESGDLLDWKLVAEYLPDLTSIPNFVAPAPKDSHFGAPKMFYDDAEDTFIITWHSPSGTVAPWNGGEHRPYWDSMRTLYVTTKDFKTFTKPRRLLPYEFASIDVLIRKEGSDYFAIFKDEKTPSSDWPTGKSLRIARAKHPLGPYGEPFAKLSKSWREAPALAIHPDGKGYYLYYEVYPVKGYEMSSAPSLAGPWTPAPGDSFSVPQNTRHGCILAISKKEYARLLEAFPLAGAVAPSEGKIPTDPMPKASAAEPVAAVTPAQWLKAQPKPKFQKGYTLPPLTRYGWTLPLDARIELTENWGYALEYGGYVCGSQGKLADPNSIESKLVALAASDPKRYPLSVICCRTLPAADSVPAETWAHDAEGKIFDAQARSMDGTEWEKGMKSVYSPNAPDSVWEEAGRLRADPIRIIREKCPIAIVLNGGEYGLGVLGFAQKVWEKDPTILAAKGDKPWFDYISERKARSEMLIADAVKAVTPDRQLYIYYPTTGGTHRNKGGDWRQWMYGYQWMKPVSDLASSEHYHRGFNSGWMGKDDILTQALNARGFEIFNGQPHCYDWLCAGWPFKNGLGSGGPDRYNDGGLGDLERYAGFIKCMYVAGMLGGNAGYYAYPKGGFGATFPADKPPHWLQQMVVLSRMHALFSHLENYIRNGDFLPGPDMHRWSKDQPAYEFPTGSQGARVLARKLKNEQQWLIVAWAADGQEQAVSVEIPELGKVQLQALPNGAVYTAQIRDGKSELKLFDMGGE